MARYDAMAENFEEVMVLGKPAIFTSLRIDAHTVPTELYLYEVRHDDDSLGDPVQIAKNIVVNHWGTIIVREPLRLPSDGFLDINPETDWAYGTGDCRTVMDFLKKYPKEKVSNLNTQLYQKMFAEQQEYREWLITLPQNEILHHTYEYTVREDILLSVEGNDLEPVQAKALLKSDSPLADIFKDFEKRETDYMNDIRNTVESRANRQLDKQRTTRKPENLSR